MDGRIQELVRDAVADPSPSAEGRLQHALGRTDWRPYLLGQLTKHPNSESLRNVYVGLGGVWARLVNDDVLGPSLYVALPQFEGKREDVIIGLGNLEGGRGDAIGDWLSNYTARAHGGTREDGVIVTPLRLETAVAVGMDSIRDVPLFAPEVDAYRTSFQESVEDVWPAYGRLVYGEGVRARLSELSLDGRLVERDVRIPVLPGGYAVLAPAQSEEGRVLSELAPGVESCLEGLSGNKNPAGAFQRSASRMGSHKRETRLWAPGQNGRRQVSERALVLGRSYYFDDDRFYIGADVNMDDFGPARGCRRAKNLPEHL